MKKSALLFASAAMVAFTSCNSDNGESSREATHGTVTIAHVLDTVEVPVNPLRVVALDYSALENLDLIGAKIVGIPKSGLPKYLSKYRDDAAIADVGNLVEVDMEKINELDPDLIIMGGRLQDSYTDMSGIAPTIIPVWDTKDQLGALEKNLHNLGEIFDKQAEFDSALADIKAKANAVKEKASTSEAKALVVLHNKGRFSAYGSGSRFGLIHDILGVKEAATGLETHLHGTTASNEFILQTNPDILFIVDRSAAVGDAPLDKREVENKLIQQTNAYKNGKVIYLDPEAWYLSGGGVASINVMIDEAAKAL